MYEYFNEFTVETKSPERDFEFALRDISAENQRRRKFLHVDSSAFQPTHTRIARYHFIAEGVVDDSKTIVGMPFVVSRYKSHWEKQLDMSFNIADLKIHIPKVQFILDKTVEPPIIICRATL